MEGFRAGSEQLEAVEMTKPEGAKKALDGGGLVQARDFYARDRSRFNI